MFFFSIIGSWKCLGNGLPLYDKLLFYPVNNHELLLRNKIGVCRTCCVSEG